MGLTDAVAGLKDAVGLLLNSHFKEWPPEQINEFPTVVVYPESGPSRFGTADDGTGHATYWNADTVTVMLVVPRKDLARDYETLAGFVDPLRQIIFYGFHTSLFGGTTVMLGDPRQRGGPAVSYEILPINWGGTDLLALKFSALLTTEDQIEG